jgi:putative transposase
MGRQARIVIPGVAHHVTQRGNYRQDVFFTDDDRRVYLSYLRESAQLHGLAVSAYCLMTNHVHLVATPERGESLAKTMGRTHLMYAQYIHRLHGRLGHLWQNRFYSCPMDDDYTHNATAYVELNPVRAGMVEAASDYAWSSARAHCDLGGDPSRSE